MNDHTHDNLHTSTHIPAPRKHFPVVQALEVGWRLQGRLLWFDVLDSDADVSLLSEVPRCRLPSLHSRFMMPPPLARLLAAGGAPATGNPLQASPMICEYFHPLSFGVHEIEFLPAGSVMGRSSVHVCSHGEAPFIYAPHATPCRVSFWGKSHLKPAHTCILRAHCLDLDHPIPPKQVVLQRLKEALEEFYRKHQHYPALIAPSLGVAQELTYDLCAHGMEVSVHGKIHRFHKAYEEQGIVLGGYLRYQKKHISKRVVIMPLWRDEKKLRALMQGFPHAFLVAGDLASYLTLKDRSFFARSFLCAQEPTLADTHATLEQVAPKRVILFGSHTKHYRERLRHTGLEITVAFPYNQPTLFDLANASPSAKE